MLHCEKQLLKNKWSGGSRVPRHGVQHRVLMQVYLCTASLGKALSDKHLMQSASFMQSCRLSWVSITSLQ